MTQKDIFFIAEIGINHNGDIETAKKLIDMAKECGCDAVKFQKRTIDIIYKKDFLDSPRESPWGKTQRDQKAGLEFGEKEYTIIDKYCKEKAIAWFASPWDEPSQLFLRKFHLKYNKVASALLTHDKLLTMIAEEKKHTFISTGMSSWKMIDHAVDIFRKNDCPFTLLHCLSTYPSEDEECNIMLVKTIKERYGCEVGYSGHEKGILPSVLSVAFGATVIERHITLDRTMYGSDQAASLERRGLELLIRDARRVKAILGDGQIKEITSKEAPIAKKLRYHEE
ncbi:MAG TPA: N-acetylneuraminate synthase family protein [Elusimicrobiota bacterium]|nr:N-acetylneuraminate synthase family protein [Elusimicrobiota bacterium]